MEVLTRNNSCLNENIYHINTTQEALTIFDRNPHSTYQYVERRPEPASAQCHPQTSDYSSFKNETARIHSFNNQWPVDCPVDKHELARAGLFFTGPGDRVQCAWCQGGLYNWVQGDTGFGEHATHFPSCPFVTMSRSASVVNSTTNSPAIPAITATTTNNAETTSQSTAASAHWTKLLCVIAILDLGYSTHEVETAVNNLATKGISKSELTTDLIMDDIFTTELSPMNEQPESVTTPAQHEAYTEANDDKTVHVQTTNPNGGKTTIEPRKDAGEFIGQISRLKQENDALKSSMTCKICLDARVGELFLPCRHLVCCVECSMAVKECPLCREHIVGTIKTFL